MLICPESHTMSIGGVVHSGYGWMASALIPLCFVPRCCKYCGISRLYSIFNVGVRMRILGVAFLLLVPSTAFAGDTGDASFLTQLRAQAEHGGPKQQLMLANLLHEGVSKDDREAFKWWQRAAAAGDAQAQLALATAYRNGYGVAKDDLRAAEWERRAGSDQGMCCPSGWGHPDKDGVMAR
jgi:hypothetical protein